MKKIPIFIVGCPRSGTTLIRVILDSHPNICCGPETHIIEKIIKLDKNIHKNWNMLKPYGVDELEYDKKIGEILTLFTKKYVLLKKKKRWAEKTPENIFNLDFINRLFPDCQIINVIRDGRDVVTSFKKRWGLLTIPTAIRKWNNSIELTLSYRKKFEKNRYLEVRYEEIVNSPEIETKKIMSFLDERWTPKLLEHHKNDHDFWFDKQYLSELDLKSEKNPERHSPSAPVFVTSVGRWKKELNFFEKAYLKIFMNKNLKKMGYI
jgi:hypothetical protein